MRSSRPFCSAAALPDGDAGDDGRKIFVVGVNGSGAEIYDPVADTWEDCGDGYAPTSAPGLGPPFQICTGTGPAAAASAFPVALRVGTGVQQRSAQLSRASFAPTSTSRCASVHLCLRWFARSESRSCAKLVLVYSREARVDIGLSHFTLLLLSLLFADCIDGDRDARCTVGGCTSWVATSPTAPAPARPPAGLMYSPPQAHSRQSR